MAHNDGHQCSVGDPQLLSETWMTQVKLQNGDWVTFYPFKEWDTEEKARAFADSLKQARVVRITRELIEG